MEGLDHLFTGLKVVNRALEQGDCLSPFDYSALPQDKLLCLDLAAGEGRFGDMMLQSAQSNKPYPVLRELAGSNNKVRKRGVHWVSVDNNHELVQSGQALAAHSLPEVEPHHQRKVANIRDLFREENPVIPPNSFDMVSICFPDEDVAAFMDECWKEVFRVLRGDGIFLLRHNGQCGKKKFTDRDWKIIRKKNLKMVLDEIECRSLVSRDMKYHDVTKEVRTRFMRVETWTKKIVLDRDQK